MCVIKAFTRLMIYETIVRAFALEHLFWVVPIRNWDSMRILDTNFCLVNLSFLRSNYNFLGFLDFWGCIFGYFWENAILFPRLSDW